MFRDTIIFALYRVLTIAAFPLLLLYVLRRSLRDRRYARHLGERFGILSPQFQRTVRDTVWLHAVSVGEVLSCVELVRRIRAALPDAPVFVSCSTLAGREAAEKRLSGVADAIFYGPFDYVFAIRAVIRRIRPAAVVVLETEIWPNLYREAKRAGCALIVVNGRISDKALPQYTKYSWFFRAVLRLPDAILVQSALDQERYLAAGAPPEKVQASGNLKFDFDPQGAVAPTVVREWAGASSGPILIAASTVGPEFDGDVDEDYAVIDALAEVPGVRVIVAPRKPERFDLTAAAFDGSGVRFMLRTRPGSDRDAPVLLLDTVGELSSVFPLADVVFMGGTLAHRGGHNILEPALFGKPVIVGPHLENFAAIQQTFRSGDGFLEIEGPEQLGGAVQRLLDDETLRQALGERGRRLAEAERGATDRAVAAIVEARWRAVPSGVPSLPLRALSHVWTAGGRLKRRWTETRRLPRPVISVGGIAMGGSGKTPVVRAIAKELHSRRMRVAVLTRGYRRSQSEPVTVLRAGQTAPVSLTGDEAQILLQDATADIGIGADRYQAGLAVGDCDVYLLDDGFQHARLHRDLDIVLLDGLDPFAGSFPFPAGRMREPLAALQRADLIAITRPEGRRFDGVLARTGPAVVVPSRPLCWVEARTRQRLPVDALRGVAVYAFCGIANPEAFRRTLQSAGCVLSDFRSFTDHALYSQDDFVTVANEADRVEAQAIVMTEKDAVKFDGFVTTRPVFYLVIEADISALITRIIETCQQPALPDASS